MKHVILLFTTSVLILSVSAQLTNSLSDTKSNGDPSKVGILPQQRKGGITIQDDGIMPFGATVQRRQASTTTKKENTQEDQIRDAFGRIRVTGASNDGKGVKRILAGDIVLEKGKPVDQIISNQTDQLMVSDITDSYVEIIWLEKQRSNQPRTLKIPIDLNPKVHFVIKAQPEGQKKPLGVTDPRMLPTTIQPEVDLAKQSDKRSLGVPGNFKEINSP